MGRGQGTMSAAVMAPARTERCSNATSLARLGVTADELRAHQERTQPESFTAAWLDTPDGDPIAGIVFQCDYASEQESGIGTLRKTLTSKDPRRFQMTDEARANVAIFSDCNGLVLSNEKVPSSRIAWGEALAFPRWEGDRRAEREYARDFERKNDWMHAVPRRWSMQELRDKARELGISPLPARKDDLRLAIGMHDDFEGGNPELWPAYFAFGDKLVLRADGSGLTARIISKLADAADNGTLAIGSASSAFHSGMFFYDARDETPQLISDREAQFDWHDARMDELTPVKELLQAEGHRWFFLGNPSEITRNGVTEVRYWLNGSGSPQPYGWYTLEELLDQKFVDDARAQKEAQRQKAQANR